ncbi:PDZ domain-containing protein [Natronosporangium hydrolyticum]|uniref:Tricorn protease homolog n=1 Tax=Natronosporangium hydrolyticum TaxID=2811111 RepID=A0A895YCW9_9ACTN|nr:S41 family peptidase [Natronosporangium hydrolyticum]QSB13199.1 PDZ domain-containing protein [Natronosporangium hydrolyticum]
MPEPRADTGYLRTPTIAGEHIVFSCDDDLWLASTGGGRAWRLTSGVAEASGPRLSQDGQLLAFVGRDEGTPDVYVMPAAGGVAERVTHQGGQLSVAGFDPADGAVLYATDGNLPFRRERWLHRVDPAGGLPRRLPLGPASAISHGPAGGVVIGRHVDDPARWKRYRGGQVGDLWVDPAGSGEFQRLLRLPGNLADPCWVGDRIYFLADHEGVGNVYSCTPAGEDLRRHTDHTDYYARGLSGDGDRLVYTAGARLYLLDPAAGGRELPVTLASSRTQRNRQFVAAREHLDTVTLAADGSQVAITTRGKAFTFGPFAGPVHQHGERDGVRYRLLTHLADGERLVAAASDQSDQESLVVFAAAEAAAATAQPLTGLDIGRARELAASPTEALIAIANHRHELLLVDLRPEPATVTTVDHSRYGTIEDLAWSPDGGWLAYTYATGPRTTAIKLARPGEEPVLATQPVLRDYRPAFDPAGRYLYFIGKRTFNPTYDELQFDLGFPMGSRPYAITLRADAPPPFLPRVEPLAGAGAAAGGDPDSADSSDAPPQVRIDLAGIDRRVVPVPVPEGRYERVAGTREKVLFSSRPVVGVADRSVLAGPEAEQTLEMYDLTTGERDRLAGGLSDFWLSPDGKTLLYRADDRLRVVKAGTKLEEADRAAETDGPGRRSGWVDLDRVKVSVRPGAEWRQMFREAWRLQRENFWDEDMSGVDWEAVYQRYLPLVDQVATRSEFSDLLWELQGELGTSHAYEFGGAYRPSPQWRQGYLGVDWAPAGPGAGYRIDRLLAGDPWEADRTSAFHRPGVDVRPGDEVLAINGTPVSAELTPARLLVNQAEQEVEVTLRRGDDPPWRATVRALPDERPPRYRDWVAANRQWVHEQTDGRVGYLHVPDMSAVGYAEFHRGFLTELDREALLVDVRNNGGGHVSGLLLQKLARRRLAYNFSRWGEPSPYPDESPRGPLVAVTNEDAGSDGDIFSHAFKQLGLGPLVGKRTWGGVVGIWPRHLLADGTMTTQPEFSFAFDDVGWRVENYGTDPDIEVEITPQDYVAGRDPQLSRAIQCALEALAVTPAHTPNPAARPHLG